MWYSLRGHRDSDLGGPIADRPCVWSETLWKKKISQRAYLTRVLDRRRGRDAPARLTWKFCVRYVAGSDGTS